MLLPQNRTIIARIGAYSLHATHDPRKTTAAGTRAFLASFERQVDPDNVLPEDERTRRALAARKAHFLRLALRSAQVRRERRQRRNGGGADGGK